jgi:hypothetical protein
MEGGLQDDSMIFPNYPGYDPTCGRLGLPRARFKAALDPISCFNHPRKRLAKAIPPRRRKSSLDGGNLLRSACRRSTDGTLLVDTSRASVVVPPDGRLAMAECTALSDSVKW